MGGFTKIPKLSVGDLGSEGTGDRIVLFDEAGDLVGWKPNAESGGGGAVDSVNGQTGVVVLSTSNIADSTDKRYVSDADLIKIANAIQGSGTLNKIPVFSPDGKNLINSRISQIGNEETRITSPLEPSLNISFFPNSSKHLRLFRNQSRMDFTINNPNTTEENIISSQNFYGTSLKSSGFLRFLVRESALETQEGNLEAMRILGTGLVQISGTGTKGLVGTSLFNKQNDPYSFAQLGDLATRNETGTPLSLSDLNTAYPTQPAGFKVFCKEIGLTYMKSSLTTWEETRTLSVV